MRSRKEHRGNPATYVVSLNVYVAGSTALVILVALACFAPALLGTITASEICGVEGWVVCQTVTWWTYPSSACLWFPPCLFDLRLDQLLR